MAILQDKTNGKAVTTSDLLAIIAGLKADNDRLKARGNRPVTCKVSEKGALSIYGLGRFPVTLYKSQFDKLASAWADVVAFVEENASSFSVKD